MVLISDNEANALRMSGKTFAQDERYVLYYRLLCRSEFLPIPSPSEKEMNLHVN
jgi:hypothetical protein